MAVSKCGFCVGSSPHTRGALACDAQLLFGKRIIPAYAGSTASRSRAKAREADHPRIRGEHIHEVDRAYRGAGSSPHTRGARARRRRQSLLLRIIPAYAGSTNPDAPCACRKPDHPRIRGEHPRIETARQRENGSSPHTRGARAVLRYSEGGREDHPRIRGEHGDNADYMMKSRGSSPHTRGARSVERHVASADGIIPAYAGSTKLRSPSRMPAQDHPRIRGEHWRYVSHITPFARIIPAYAGSTPTKSRKRNSGRDHPRIRGEHWLLRVI